MLCPTAITAQVFITGMAGAAALTNAASASASPLRSANYDSKVGPALTLAIGYHLNDWFSVQGGYFWNQNRIIKTEIAELLFTQSESTSRQDNFGVDLMVYVRARRSRFRPFLSAGPGLVRTLSASRVGLRVAVGADIAMGSGWGVRYTFNETMTPNALGAALNPPASGRLMTFRNMIGVVKTF